MTTLAPSSSHIRCSNDMLSRFPLAIHTMIYIWAQVKKIQYYTVCGRRNIKSFHANKTFQNETINHLCWLYFAFHCCAVCGMLKMS